MALTSGTKLGPYEILSPLGAGGMGEVYRAKDTRLDRTVAIKVLPTHLSDDPELKQRMEREAKAISALQHSNICTLYDIGTQDGTDFLVMELSLIHISPPNPHQSDTQWFIGIGGGFDLNVSRRVGWRLATDYVNTHLFSNLLVPRQNYWRFSTGPTFRWGHLK